MKKESKKKCEICNNTEEDCVISNYVLCDDCAVEHALKEKY